MQELRVIVASATLDAEQFRDFFETNRWVGLSATPLSAPLYPSLQPSVRAVWCLAVNNRIYLHFVGHYRGHL